MCHLVDVGHVGGTGDACLDAPDHLMIVKDWLADGFWPDGVRLRKRQTYREVGNVTDAHDPARGRKDSLPMATIVMVARGVRLFCASVCA